MGQGRGDCDWRLVEGGVAEYCQEDVGSAACEAEDGLGVVLSLGDLSGVVPMQVHQVDRRTLVQRKLAAAITLAG
jgi:hypothetical protein